MFRLVTKSIPKNVGQVPIYYNHKMTCRPYNQGYVDGDAEPLYPFGYGLSYTTFEYSKLSLSSNTMGVSGEMKVSITKKNTGNRDGEEIVQLYVRDIVGSVTLPVKELKLFKIVIIRPSRKPFDSSYIINIIFSYCRLTIYNNFERFIH